jgi:PmbA protein
VRKGDVETIAYNRDKGISVTVYLGQRRGHASSADFAEASIRDTVAKALAIARFTAEDPSAGLADADRLAKRWGDLDLYHPWDLSVDEAIVLGRDAEAAALGVDKRITNSDGSSVSRGESEFVYANSAGFHGGYRSSRHSIDVSVIGEDGEGMQRDYWYSAARAPGDLARGADVGPNRRRAHGAPPRREAAFDDRMPGAVRGAGSRRPDRRIRAGRVGRQPLPQVELPPRLARHAGLLTARHDPRGSRTSSAHAAARRSTRKGVATEPRVVVDRGVVNGYFLGSYAARKLGMRSTGNAGGSHNLVVSHGDDDLAALMRRMGRGLFVTEQLGQGVNGVTGDYSRGAAGFWIENGEIAHPVEEVTIAGNLRDMYRDIVAIGRDVDRRGSRTSARSSSEG